MDIGGCSSAEPFALQVLGDSMAPEFQDGAIIIIDPSGVVEDGCYVVAQVGEEYMFRQLRTAEGEYELSTLNGPEAPVRVTTEEIIGVVVQKAGRRRRDHKHYA